MTGRNKRRLNTSPTRHTLRLEPLEPRLMLATVQEVEGNDTRSSGQGLPHEPMVQVAGSISGLDVDYFKVEAGAGDALSVALQSFVASLTAKRAQDSSIGGRVTAYDRNTGTQSLNPFSESLPGYLPSGSITKEVSSGRAFAKATATFSSELTSSDGSVMVSVSSSATPYASFADGSYVSAEAFIGATAYVTFAVDRLGTIEIMGSFSPYPVQTGIREPYVFTFRSSSPLLLDVHPGEDVSVVASAFASWYDPFKGEGGQSASASASWSVVPLETRLGLFDGSGTLLKAGSDALNYEFQAAGAYYIAVARDGDNNFDGRIDISGQQPSGEYELTVEIESTLPDIKINSVAWNAQKGGLDVAYAVNKSDLIAGQIVVGVYWSSGRVATATVHNASPSQTSVHIPVTSFAPPSKEDNAVRVILDDGNHVTESNESNNEGTAPLIINVLADVQLADDPPLLRGDTLIATAFVINRSPFPVNVDISAGFTTETPGLSVPSPTKTARTLSFGETVPLVQALPLTWEWIPQANPLKDDPSIAINLLLDLISLERGVAPLWPPGYIIEKIYEIADHFLVEIPRINAVYNKQIKRAIVSFGILVTPQAAGQSSVTSRDFATALVSEDKLSAFDDFVISAQNLADLMFSISFIGAGNTRTAAVEKAIEIAGLLDRKWQRAYDPPDPEYQKYIVPVYPLPDAINLISPGPLREQAKLQSFVTQLQVALSASIDKKDGAAQDANPTWQVEQLIAASNQAHRAQFNLIRAGAMESLLLRYRNQFIATGAEAAAILQEQGLSTEVEQILLNSGWPAADVAELDTAVRTLTAEDLEKYGAEVGLGIDYWSYVATAAESFSLFSEAMRLRTEKLGFTSRTPTVAETAALDNFRQQVELIVASGAPAPGLFELLENYSAEARRLALATNNFTAVSQHLEFAYLVPVNEPVRFANLGGWKTLVADRAAQGEIDVTVFNALTDDANDIETFIAAEEWNAADAALFDLIETVAAIPMEHITVAARTAISFYLQYLHQVLNQSAVVPTPEIVGLSSELVVPEGRVVRLASQASIADTRIGTLAGGRLEVRIEGDGSEQLGIASSTLIQITPANEIVMDGEVVGTLIEDPTDQNLRIEFRAAATPERVSEILRLLILEATDESEMDSQTIELVLADGVGGVSQEYAMVLEFVGPLLAGDYDSDGDADGMDYQVWRRTFGSAHRAFAGADGNGDGRVDSADYVVWRNNVGATVEGIASNTTDVRIVDAPLAPGSTNSQGIADPPADAPATTLANSPASVSTSLVQSALDGRKSHAQITHCERSPPVTVLNSPQSERLGPTLLSQPGQRIRTRPSTNCSAMTI